MDNDCKVVPKPKNIKEFFRSSFFWKPFIAIIAGGIAGFVVYYFISCDTNICTFSGSTISTIFTGSLFGLLLTNSPCLKCSSVRK